jgi:hypothetical protein
MLAKKQKIRFLISFIEINYSYDYLLKNSIQHKYNHKTMLLPDKSYNF